VPGNSHARFRGGKDSRGSDLPGSATRSVDNQYGVIPSGLPNDLPLTIHAMSRACGGRASLVVWSYGDNVTT
jgi:hypothetical protein